jgi:drug/metabolite transporter (DMT)-like permease
MKYLAYGSFLFIVLCFGTYYAVTKEALGHIPPTVFACGTMLLLLPVALVLCLLVSKDITREVLIRGSLLGGCLCAVTLLLTVALQYTSATATAFFPCLNGLLAALFTRLVLRRFVPRLTWGAAILALLGMGLMTASTTISLDEWRGTLLALLGSLTYTSYIFLFDRLLIGYQTTRPTGFWPVLGIQLLTMAAGGLVVLLLFGDWQGLHPEPKDVLALLYVAVFILLLPLLLAARLQHYVNPTSVAFIYMLEPVLGALAAFLYLHETFPLSMYIGQGLVFCGVLLQTVLGLVPEPGNGSHHEVRDIPTRRVHNSFHPGQARGMLAGLVAVVLLGGISAAVDRWTPATAAPSLPMDARTSIIVGYASFESSGILDTQLRQGINDALQLDLAGVPSPGSGKAYYAWLLVATGESRKSAILLGMLPWRHGSMHLRYLDPQHVDLLAVSAHLLISVGSAHAPPANPFLDTGSWRYYGQPPAFAASHAYIGLLDQLLIAAPQMPGGLRLWFLITVRTVLEGASALRGTADAQDPSFLRSDLYRILEELDGRAFVEQDVPSGTPLYDTSQAVSVPLLQLQPGQNPPSSISQMELQLAALAHSSDIPQAHRQLANSPIEKLHEVAALLQQVRQDVKHLLSLNDVQLTQPAAQPIMDDLLKEASDAYSGIVNQETGEREGGALWIADQLERLVALPVMRCDTALCSMSAVAYHRSLVQGQQKE